MTTVSVKWLKTIFTSTRKKCVREQLSVVVVVTWVDVVLTV